MRFLLWLSCFAHLCWSFAAREELAGSLARKLNGRQSYSQTCIVESQDDGSDDAPSIIQAFERCQQDSHVVFLNTTYHINQVLKFDNLENVKIEINGTLKWSDDTQYWLNNSLPIGPGKDQESYPPAAYQNQTTAFILGGSNLVVEGHGFGTFDGNGQAWYDLVKGESNYPNRPHALVVTAQDSYFHGLRFVQPQMWTVTVVGSQRVLLEDIFISATSNNSNPARNTDGANTIFSDSITFRRWHIDNGDDCIAAKANSTNILIEDSVFFNGQGVAIGSIGQYNDRFETVENVTARNITMHNVRYLGRIKTWTGEQNGYPPNGGGGGLGFAQNISFQDISITEGSHAPLVINQCYTLNGASANCSTSTFDIGNVAYENISGTISISSIAKFQCSRSQNGCEGISFDNVSLTDLNTGSAASGISCSNVISPKGFTCD